MEPGISMLGDCLRDLKLDMGIVGKTSILMGESKSGEYGHNG